MKTPAIAGIILSAGASRRMGSPKALLKINGISFLDRLMAAFEPVCDGLIVVLGYDAERICESSGRKRVEFVLNPDPARGMFSSLQCGLRSLPGDAEAAIFTPVDYPCIQPATVATLHRVYAGLRCPVIVPCYEGRHGHPVCISRRVIAEMLALPATAQARDLIHAYRTQTEFVEVDDPGILTDIDIPEDYCRLQSQAAEPDILKP